MSRDISVYVASPDIRNVVELAQQVAAILGTELLESELVEFNGEMRCPFVFWEQVDDELSLQCFICDKDEDMTYLTSLTSQTYHYQLSMQAYGYKPNTDKEAHIRCGRFIFDKLKATNRYGLLLVLDFSVVIEEFSHKLSAEDSRS